MNIEKRLKKRSLSRQRRVSNKLDRVSKLKHKVLFFRSNKSLYLQLLDVATGNILASMNSNNVGGGKNKDVASKLGEAFGALCLKKSVDKIFFDRRGFLYHGRVVSLADGMRKSGLVF